MPDALSNANQSPVSKHRIEIVCIMTLCSKFCGQRKLTENPVTCISTDKIHLTSVFYKKTVDNFRTKLKRVPLFKILYYDFDFLMIET